MDPLAYQTLFEDGPCLVACKPAGLPTQAPPGIDSLELRIKEAIRNRRPPGGDSFVYLGVPHRLDRPASGAIAFALTRKAARRISQQFERRQIGKSYWVCVGGRVRPTEGTWTDILKKTYGKPQAEVVDESDPLGRIAILHYRTLGEFEWGTWLEVTLETGRTHQIRVQGARRGHAVLGDRLYSSTVTFGNHSDDERLRAIALHARTLSFMHPTRREPLEITAPLPAEWDGWLPRTLAGQNPLA